MNFLYKLFQKLRQPRYRVVTWYNHSDVEYYIVERRGFLPIWVPVSAPVLSVEEARSLARKMMLPAPVVHVVCYVDPAYETIENDFTRE
jgi:hypothetical protein